MKHNEWRLSCRLASMRGWSASEYFRVCAAVPPSQGRRCHVDAVTVQKPHGTASIGARRTF
jgi:hypothetical protein